MKNVIKSCLLVCATLSMIGCNSSFLTAPTETPTPTATFTPTSTPTKTPVPTKTLTTTPTPNLELGKTHIVAQGGFSFRSPISYYASVDGPQAFISDLIPRFLFTLFGGESTKSEEEIIDELLGLFTKSGDIEIIKESSYPVTIAGVEGLAFDISGSRSSVALVGQTFAVFVSPNHFVFGIGFANAADANALWAGEGSMSFHSVLDSIEYIDPETSKACPTSTDKTYGYTQENAIRVGDGGSFFGGPALEREYLDNLRGPNGERLTYERTGSLPFENTILDAYVVSGLANPVTLYLDIYSFEELSAPVGFACIGPFNTGQ